MTDMMLTEYAVSLCDTHVFRCCHHRLVHHFLDQEIGLSQQPVCGKDDISLRQDSDRFTMRENDHTTDAFLAHEFHCVKNCRVRFNSDNRTRCILTDSLFHFPPSTILIRTTPFPCLRSGHLPEIET